MPEDGAPAGESSSYEELTAELAAVLEELERGDLSLDAALATYQRGVGLVRACNDLLDRAELRVTELAAGAEPEGLSGPSTSAARGSRQQLFPFDLDLDDDEEQ